MIASRLLIVTALLLGAARLAGSAGTERVPPREPFVSFPVALADWHATASEPVEQGALERLGVDEYINRVYENQGAALGLYIGYYASQRQGDTMHSPLNCLPGAGWQPLAREYVDVPLASGQTVTVNRYIIQKGLDRQVVLYWYQSHGRVMANEYASKFYMVYDALRIHRTDAALIRIVSPVDGPAPRAQADASTRAVEFMRAMFPALALHLP